MDYPPPSRILTPTSSGDFLLLGPGPSNVSQRVRHAASLNLDPFMFPDFGRTLDDVRAGLKYVFQTQNEMTYAITASGMAGMEAAIVNAVEPGEKILILENGVWSVRATDIAERCGADVVRVVHDFGIWFPLDEVEAALKQHHPKVLFAVQGDSSTGLLQPIEGLGQLCHQYDCLLIVDTVASLGAVPFFMDKWEVDIVYSGSQKALSSVPGVAPISFSPRARAKIESRKTKVQSYYFDSKLHASYWGIGVDKRKYHSTPSVSGIYALREALALVAEEGLENSWKRHRENSDLLCKGLQESLGLELFQKDPQLRLPIINIVNIPDSVKSSWRELIQFSYRECMVEFGVGLGPLEGKIWRIGLMGSNSTPEVVQRALDVFKKGLDHIGYRPQLKSGL